MIKKNYNKLNLKKYLTTSIDVSTCSPISILSSCTRLSINWVLAKAKDVLVTLSINIAVSFNWVVNESKTSCVLFALDITF